MSGVDEGESFFVFVLWGGWGCHCDCKGVVGFVFIRGRIIEVGRRWC